MTALIDPVDIGDALIATLTAGEFQGAPINAGWREPSGLVVMPAVVVIPPVPDFEGFGEGAHVPGSTWTLQLYTDGGGLGPDPAMESAFLFAVLAPLLDDPQLGGAVCCVTPTEAPEPIIDNGGSESAPRRAYIRSLRIHIDH